MGAWDGPVNFYVYMATLLFSTTDRYLLTAIRRSSWSNHPSKSVKNLSPLARTPIKMDEQQARGQHSAQVDQWKQRAPYRIHEPNDKFNALYEANCHCGKVKYQLNREEPLDSKLCHCTTCQTQHGKEMNYKEFKMYASQANIMCEAAPFQWAAIFHKEDINFSDGHHSLEWYDPTSKTVEHKLPCKVRCSFCHSPIMDEGRNMILLFPSLIHLKNDKDKAFFKPR